MKKDVFERDAASGRDHYQARRWEGKPLAYKFKYAVSHYPEACLSLIAVLVFGPCMAAYRYFTFENREKFALTKFKTKYTVVRDDDPKVESILKEKEFIKKFFPC